MQGYNVQAAVNDHQIIIASQVSQHANDVNLYQPMVAATRASLTAAGIDNPIGTVLADAGYWSDDNATTDGPNRLIATLKDHKQRRAANELGPTSADPPDDATPIEAMEHRLRTPEGAAAYTKRSHIVEPIFAVKANHGFTRFRRRGLQPARAEWALIATVHNLGKLHRAATPPPPTVRPHPTSPTSLSASDHTLQHRCPIPRHNHHPTGRPPAATYSSATRHRHTASTSRRADISPSDPTTKAATTNPCRHRPLNLHHFATACVGCDPILGDVVGGVHRSGCEVQHERAVGGVVVLGEDVGDCFVGEVFGEVVAVVRLPRSHRGRDIYWWMDAIGQLDQRYDDVDDIDRRVGFRRSS